MLETGLELPGTEGLPFGTTFPTRQWAPRCGVPPRKKRACVAACDSKDLGWGARLKKALKYPARGWRLGGSGAQISDLNVQAGRVQ